MWARKINWRFMMTNSKPLVLPVKDKPTNPEAENAMVSVGNGGEWHQAATGDQPGLTLEGRAIGVLFADGSDTARIDAVKKVVTVAGAKVKLVAAKIGDVKLADSSLLKIDGQLAGTPSILFDAVAIILSEEAAALLSNASPPLFLFVMHSVI